MSGQAVSRLRLSALSVLILIAPVAVHALDAVNAASFAHPALPHGGVAQGSMFVAFGSGLGPAGLALPSPWPFPTELAGTSLKVTVDGVTVDCFMVYTSAGQVAAILPSSTPVGVGRIEATYNGAVVDTGTITVVPHSFGIFTINQRGLGPIVATNPLANTAVYTLRNSTAPDGYIDIWGTGLGAVGFQDEGPPTPADLGFDVQVFIGGVSVPVEYAGRSGCCSGIDLVRVRAPQDLSGCFLPVTVVVEGVTSNYGTIPVQDEGGSCLPDQDFNAYDIDQLSDGGTLRLATLAMIRTRASINVPGLPALAKTVNQGTNFEATVDTFAGRYEKVETLNLDAFSSIVPINHLGSCSVFQFVGDAEYPEVFTSMPLRAGESLTMNGPGGRQVIPLLGGTFVADFSFGGGAPGVFQKQQVTVPTYYRPGITTIDAPGGEDVQAHTASITVPEDFVWLNKAEVQAGVSRDAPLEIRYSGAGYDYINIRAYSTAIADQGDPSRDVGAVLYCAADPSSGSFVISPHVLKGLPSSTLVSGVAAGSITVGGWKNERFEAEGLDSGQIIYSDTTVQTNVNFR